MALSAAGGPDIFPVNFVIGHGTIVYRTGTKFASVVIGYAVALDVDGFDPTRAKGWSVVVHGRGEQITRSQELIDITDLPLFPWQPGDKHRFVRIRSRDVSGRRIHVVDRTAWRTPLRDAQRTSLD